MKESWKIFIDSNSIKNATIVKSKFENLLGIEVSENSPEPYHKGGFVFSIEVDTHKGSWSEIAVGVIAKAQLVGRSWQLSGKIVEEVDAWTNDSSISGIQSIHVQCMNINAS
ncbi:hypothetical protein ACFL19_01825 [Pseudomonadota bacterium]